MDDVAEPSEQKPLQDICIRCKQVIFLGIVWQGEWAHWHGDRYCHDRYTNFTLTPLMVATPAYHRPEDVL